jgi:hypothetical protein
VKSTVEGVTPPPAQQPQQQFTQEDFVRTFQVFQPTPEVLASVGLPNTPEAAVAFGNISNAIVRQAVTMAAYQMEKLKADLEAKYEAKFADYEPARAMAQERQAEKMREEFLALNPDLQGYEPLLLEIRDRLAGQGIRFKTKDEAFKAVAEHARKLISTIPGLSANGGNAQQPQTQSTPTTTGASRMSGLSGSGQGGVGGSRSNGAGGKKSTAEQLFGRR